MLLIGFWKPSLAANMSPTPDRQHSRQYTTQMRVMGHCSGVVQLI